MGGSDRHVPWAILVLVGLLMSAEAAGREYARVSLAETAGLDEAAWLPAGALDGRACRLLKAGGRGGIPLKPWWGRTLRPKEGSAYAAEITYNRHFPDRPDRLAHPR